MINRVAPEFIPGKYAAMPVSSSVGTANCFKPISGRLTYRGAYLQNIVTHPDKWGLHSKR